MGSPTSSTRRGPRVSLARRRQQDPGRLPGPRAERAERAERGRRRGPRRAPSGPAAWPSQAGPLHSGPRSGGVGVRAHRQPFCSAYRSAEGRELRFAGSAAGLARGGPGARGRGSLPSLPLPLPVHSPAGFHSPHPDPSTRVPHLPACCPARVPPASVDPPCPRCLPRAEPQERALGAHGQSEGVRRPKAAQPPEGQPGGPPGPGDPEMGRLGGNGRPCWGSQPEVEPG